MKSRFVLAGTPVIGAVAAIFITGIVLPAAAQDVQNMLNRIDRMERDMQDLQRQFYRSSGRGIIATPVTPAPPTSGASTTPAEAGNETGNNGAGFDSNHAARVEIRLQQLETLVRSLTGKIEEVEFKVEQNSSRIDRLVRDIDFRLQAIEPRVATTQPGAAVQSGDDRPPADPAQAGNPVAGKGQGVLGYLKDSEINALDNAPAPDMTAAPAATLPANPAKTGTNLPSTSAPQVLPEGPPEEQYQYAFTYLKKQDFASAERALSAFLERHPKNPLAGNAMYWLGETYYVRKDFANAAKTFAAGYTEYPGSSKTADNLLKLGFSLARMDRKDHACLTFDQLKADFPNASVNIKRGVQAEQQRIGC